MELVLNQPLSLTSALLTLCLPLIYFAVHHKYWYLPENLRKFDFLFASFVVVVGILVLYSFANATQVRSWDSGRLLLIHLISIVVTLFIVKSKKGGGQPTQIKQSSTEHSAFKPVPLNAEIERLGWQDLVISRELRNELISVVELLKDPKTANRYGIEPPKGILLNGPPGTGKTTIAKVMANVAGMSFFVLKMDEIVSTWVGESEKNLTKLFEAALKSTPAIIFIDEVDSIGKSRSSSGQQWSQNLLNHLLQLVDGVVKSKGIYLIAATNRAELVDEALKRSGRLNRVIEIPLPDNSSREQLFQLYLSKLSLESGVNVTELANLTEGKSPADIRAICNQAGLNAFKRESSGSKRNYTVTHADLEQALSDALDETRI